MQDRCLQTIINQYFYVVGAIFDNRVSIVHCLWSRFKSKRKQINANSAITPCISNYVKTHFLALAAADKTPFKSLPSYLVLDILFWFPSGVPI